MLATIGTLSQTQLEWLKRELADRDVVTFFDTDEAGDKYRSKVAQLGLKLTQVKLPDCVKDIDEYLHGDNPLPLTELVAAFTLVEPVAEVEAEAEAEAEAVQDDDQQPEVVKVMPRTAIFENELNDSANAERFVQMHGHNLKFVPELGGFIYFDGTHWTQNDLTPMILAQTVGKEIQEIGQMLIKQACKKEELSWAYAVLRHGSSSLNRAGIQNMLELAKPMMTARLHELNANPMLLGTANGVIDLKSGRLLAPRRAFMITHHSPVAYDPAAVCPRWEQFIGEITCDDAEYAAFLQRCVGYWITARTEEQLLFFLHGAAATARVPSCRSFSSCWESSVGRSAVTSCCSTATAIPVRTRP